MLSLCSVPMTLFASPPPELWKVISCSVMQRFMILLRIDESIDENFHLGALAAACIHK